MSPADREARAFCMGAATVAALVILATYAGVLHWTAQ